MLELRLPLLDPLLYFLVSDILLVYEDLFEFLLEFILADFCG